jgi:hypothetical protein
MAEKESPVRVLGNELRPHAIWALIVWIGSLAGGTMITALVALLQKLRHVSLDWFFIGGLFLLSFGVLALLLYLAKRISPVPKAADSAASRPPEPQGEARKAPRPEPTEPPEKTWGEIMAEEDAKNIQERVLEISQRKEFHYDPASDPYIDIITELGNASVFDLVSFGEISGHGTYAGSQLAQDPRVLASVEPVMVRIKHGDKATLTVRQFLSSGVADTMVANLNRGVSLSFESVSVSFKMRSPTGSSQTYRWWGPRFTIEEATRV